MDDTASAAEAVDLELDPADEPPENLVIKLRKPVNWPEGPNAITYTELNLREPLGHEWEQWDGLQGAAANMKAISVIAAIPLPAVKQMGTRDLSEATAYIGRFF